LRLCGRGAVGRERRAAIAAKAVVRLVRSAAARARERERGAAARAELAARAVFYSAGRTDHRPALSVLGGSRRFHGHERPLRWPGWRIEEITDARRARARTRRSRGCGLRRLSSRRRSRRPSTSTATATAMRGTIRQQSPGRACNGSNRSRSPPCKSAPCARSPTRYDRRTLAGGVSGDEAQRVRVEESRARQVKGSQHHQRGGPEAASPDSY